MTAQTALFINEWIDRVHNPSYWIIFWVIALYILLEYTIFPKKKIVLNTLYSRIVLYAKFGILLLTLGVGVSQSLLGGCAIQLIQNYLATQCLGLEYWYPFGLVFRENVDPEYWIWLRIGYGLITIGYGFWIYRYYVFIMGKLKKS